MTNKEQSSTLNLNKNSFTVSAAAILFLASVIWGIATFQAKAEATERKVNDLTTKFEESERVKVEILQRLTEIQTNLTNVQTDVTDIKKKI